jgi:hypothetical protein
MPDAIPLIREAFPILEYKPRDTARWNEAFRKFKPLLR